MLTTAVRVPVNRSEDLSVPSVGLGSVRLGAGFTFTALGTVSTERLVVLSLRAMVLGSWGVTILTHTLPGSDVNVTEDETWFWRYPSDNRAQ